MKTVATGPAVKAHTWALVTAGEPQGEKVSDGTTLNLSMRPHDFDEVIGLENEVAAIKKVVDSGTIPRAFILKGPFGCGKTTLAFLIARYIQGWDFAGTPVTQEINAANITGVDAMRKLVETAGSYPMAGKYGVIILDEAHKLSKAAQELLLKEFEVPKSPTVWVVCTSEHDKLIEGIRAGRCFTLEVRGMDDEKRKTLVERAAKKLEHEGDVSEFLTALKKAKVVSPRKILMAFELYHNGIPATQAVGAMSFEALPEYWEICMGVVFGQWGKGYTLPWIRGKDGQPRQFPAVCEQLKALDDKLKKKPKDVDAPAPAPPVDDAAESDDQVDDEDAQGRPEVAAALRAITAATLKGQIIRETKKFNMVKAQKAADSLFILAHCVGANSFGLEFSAVVGGLFRVNQKMQGAATV